jgi:hypothetical protein
MPLSCGGKIKLYDIISVNTKNVVHIFCRAIFNLGNVEFGLEDHNLIFGWDIHNVWK